MWFQNKLAPTTLVALTLGGGGEVRMDWNPCLQEGEGERVERGKQIERGKQGHQVQHYGC